MNDEFRREFIVHFGRCRLYRRQQPKCYRCRWQSTRRNSSLIIHRSSLKNIMETIRLVLNVPFMRYPPGTVFELEASNEFSGWEDDERLREKQSFSDKRIYHLPDGGRGFATTLPASNTSPCPPAAFDGVDLRTGPCRITAAASGIGENLAPGDGALPCGMFRESDASLAPLNGVNAQGIHIVLPESGSHPQRILLRDVLRGTDIRTLSVFDREATLDFSDLLPGFYQLLFQYKNNCVHSLRFIKSFPLLITLERNSSRFTTQQTLY